VILPEGGKVRVCRRVVSCLRETARAAREGEKSKAVVQYADLGCEEGKFISSINYSYILKCRARLFQLIRLYLQCPVLELGYHRGATATTALRISFRM